MAKTKNPAPKASYKGTLLPGPAPQNQKKNPILTADMIKSAVIALKERNGSSYVHKAPGPLGP